MTVVSDNFDRADSTSLGANWAEDDGDWSIATNRLRSLTSGSVYHKVRWTGTALSTNDVAVEAVVRTGGNTYGAGVFARGAASSTVTCYALVLFATAGVYLVELTAGGEGILASYTTSPPAANTDVTLRLEVEGSSLRGYVDGTLRVTASDATLASGAVGIIAYSGNSTTDAEANNWQAYDYAPADYWDGGVPTWNDLWRFPLVNARLSSRALTEQAGAADELLGVMFWGAPAAGGTTFPQSVTGALTASGSALRVARKGLAGALAPAAAL
ncbi:MAG: hypothetical protein ACRC1H_18770, partial [Caldilineaceae bacterium]